MNTQPNRKPEEAKGDAADNMPKKSANVMHHLDTDTILDLPDEVKKNIVGYEDLEMDEMILRILRCFTAPVSCDRIIQMLWTQYKKNPDRSKVMARLRHMYANKQIEKMDGCRSMYRSLPPLMAHGEGQR